MPKLNTVKSDLTTESSGVWVTHPAGFKFKIARMNNPEYAEFMKKITKPYRRQAQRGALPEDVTMDLLVQCVCHHIIKDWEEVEDDDGTALPFSPEKAYEILSKREYRDLLDFIIQTAQDQEIFKAQEMEEAEGN